MIRPGWITALCVALCTSTSALADVREVGRAELREMVSTGHGLGLGSILKSVEGQTKGEAVDIRAFDDGGLIYTILIMLPDGRMGTVYVDGTTGKVMSPNTNRSKAVKAASKKAKAGNGAAAAAAASRTGASNATSPANGNSAASKSDKSNSSNRATENKSSSSGASNGKSNAKATDKNASKSKASDKNKGGGKGKK